MPGLSIQYKLNKIKLIKRLLKAPSSGIYISAAVHVGPIYGIFILEQVLRLLIPGKVNKIVILKFPFILN